MEGQINIFTSVITDLCQIVYDGFARIVITGGYLLEDGLDHTQTILEVISNR